MENVTADQLRSYVERAEQLDAEKQDIAEAKKELMAEEDAILEMYKTALGM